MTPSTPPHDQHPTRTPRQDTGLPPLRVTLVDDHPVSVAGFGVLLAPFGDRVRVVEVADALAATARVDIVLYEPAQLSAASTYAVHRLVSLHAASAVAYSWQELPDLAASDRPVPRLSKLAPAVDLVSALEELRGLPAVPPPRSPSAGHTVGGLAGLSPRELDVLRLIVRGLSNAEIGAELFLSVNSVKTYIRGAYAKIGAARRSQAVAWGMTHGLAAALPPPAAPRPLQPAGRGVGA